MPVISLPVSGPYEWSYGPKGAQDGTTVLGVVEDAVTIRWVTAEEEVVGDNLGRGTIQALINQGHACYVDIVFQEVNRKAVFNAFWPFVPHVTNAIPGAYGSGAAASLTANSVGQVRRAGAGTLQLLGRAISEAAAFPTATSTVPEYLRADRATLAPNQSLSALFGSRLRAYPVSFLCLPFADTGGAGGPTYSIVGLPDLAAPP